MKRNLLHLICAAAMLTLAACGGNGNGGTPEEPESFVPAAAPRGFLLYLAVDNTLSHMGKMNLEAVTEGATAQTLGNGVIYVLLDDPHDITRLYAIWIDPATKTRQRKEVKNYSVNLDTSLPETFTRVWGDIQKTTKVDKWVLSFGSHGSGWLPNESEETPESRALLQDSYQDFTMSIKDFAGMLPTVETLILDACDMGGIEFGWELRNKAKYLILSPAEVVSDGFPYKNIVADLFNPDALAGAKAVCEKFYDFYDHYAADDMQYGTVSLFDCSQFEGYAAAVKAALVGKKSKIEGLSMTELNAIQHVDQSEFAGAQDVIPVMYDMREFFTAIGSWTPAVADAHKKLIPYYNTTGKWLGDLIQIPKDKFCGVSTYIPSDYKNFVGEYEMNSDEEAQLDPGIVFLRNVRGYLNGEWVKTSWAKEVYPAS